MKEIQDESYSDIPVLGFFMSYTVYVDTPKLKPQEESVEPDEVYFDESTRLTL